MPPKTNPVEAFNKAATIEELRSAGIIIIGSLEAAEALAAQLKDTLKEKESLIIVVNKDLDAAKSEVTQLKEQLAVAIENGEFRFSAEVEAHSKTKEQSKLIIEDLKEKLAVANANIDSELPIVSIAGKKIIVNFPKFRLRNDPKEYTLEDLKGSGAKELAERIFATKGQQLLTEAKNN
jgi:hypothetical protein